MNKALIITIGILIILLVLCMWVYLLVFGSPQKGSEVFANLGFIAPTETIPAFVEPVPIDDTKTQLSLGNARFEQLTTRAVAGSAFSPSANPTLWYAELGTGHIFEIDLATGVETQISLTTIPQTAEAAFSPEAVAITSYQGYTKKVVAGLFTDDGSEIDFVALPDNSENVIFNDMTELYFTRTIDTQTIGYAFDVDTRITTELFRVGIPNVTVQWGYPLTEIFISTKPSEQYEGYTYKVVGNKLIPASPAKPGLTSFMNDLYRVHAYIAEDAYVTESTFEGTNSLQSIVMLPDKCVFSSISARYTFCASPSGTVQGDDLENWYKGALSFNDLLWKTDLDKQSSQALSDLSNLAGRTIDVLDIAINGPEDLLLITNKIDQTLWIYRL